MPLLTPSRIAILVLSFSLITFFWTFGLPSQLGQPSLPIIDHYSHTNVHTDPIIPAPTIESTRATAPKPTVHGDRPAEEDDHRWDDATRKAALTDGKTTAPPPLETGAAAHDEDGGRWEDKEKAKEGKKSSDVIGASTKPVPTTLAIEIIPAPSGVNVTNGTAAATTAASESAPSHSVEKFCKDVRGAPHVMVVLRTSKAEIDKLSTHLLGLLSCVPNFAIFSDHAGEIEGHTVHNALESIGSDAKRTHDEFREYQIIHADAEHKPDPKRTKDLDKWKFLPMVYKAYHLNTSAKFYVFIEADTSLSWTNLLQWVNRLDYRIPYYSGAPTFMNSVQFAQRGSGILLSQGALRRYSKSYDELYTSKWEERVGKECCGDMLLATALNDAHVEFYSSWPLLQGEQPSTLDYTRKHWCVPAVSWHHVSGESLTGMWDQERKWTHTHGWEKPYLFRDAFHEFVEPHMEAQKTEWDNLSQDTKIVAPQGRQQQMKEEEERSKKHQQEGEEKKEKEKQEDEQKKKKEQESKQFQAADSEEHDEELSSSVQRLKKRDDDKENAIDWDKLAEKFKDAGDSSERCQKACEQVDDCLQWRYSRKGDGECHLGKVLRLGSKSEGDDNWTSGWLVDRIKDVAKEWECKEVAWRFYQ
ncbi:hypothetical protein N0V83_001663 [Neocucurbitaria cava]|uniref:Glycosyltransferase family 31 protein n=1 Tax=Neocucurbitaria cava TaxID=798079 RepID=A0A9W8YFM7_9PLEO|nr:hypothetical protein N0V83_001663 [Neocucurbitaria cava]